MILLKNVEISRKEEKQKVDFFKSDEKEVLIYVDDEEAGTLILEKSTDDPDKLAGWVLYLPYFMGKKWADGTIYSTDLKEAISEVIEDMETL